MEQFSHQAEEEEKSWQSVRGVSQLICRKMLVFSKRTEQHFTSVCLSFYMNLLNCQDGRKKSVVWVTRFFFLVTWHMSIIVIYWRSSGGDRTCRDVLRLELWLTHASVLWKVWHICQQLRKNTLLCDSFLLFPSSPSSLSVCAVLEPNKHQRRMLTLHVGRSLTCRNSLWASA